MRRLVCTRGIAALLLLVLLFLIEYAGTGALGPPVATAQVRDRAEFGFASPAQARPHVSESIAPGPNRGRLASPGFAGERIRATLFFAGEANDGSAQYGGCTPKPNVARYTVTPSLSSNLHWSSDPSTRAPVLDEMIGAGINVVIMSTWGPHPAGCEAAWVKYAPMQTAPMAQDELFAAAAGKSILILPLVESHLDWQFGAEFLTATGGLLPRAAEPVVALVTRYLHNSAHPEWAASWAKVYDRDGLERYAISIIHAASDHLDPDEHALFAAGFDLLAEEVYALTGERVGFFIDPLPSIGSAAGSYRPDPEGAGAHLSQAAAVLGIQPFIPEVWTPLTTDACLLVWKRDFSRRWRQTGIPFLMDVSPGYDGHLIFPDGHPAYGNNDEWRKQLSGMVAMFGQAGMVYNSWNGYTEGMAAVPSAEYGDTNLLWLSGLTRMPPLQVRSYLPMAAAPGIPTVSPDAACRAAAFLASQYNPAVGLLRESPITAPITYWLFTDNRLASYALEAAGEDWLAHKLATSITGYLTPTTPTTHGVIEAMGHHDVEWPPRADRKLAFPVPPGVAGDVRVRAEVRDGDWMPDWEQYADFAFIGALDEYRYGNRAEAERRYELRMQMWDGVGFDDKPDRGPGTDGEYRTYKLALAVHAAVELGRSPDARILSRLLAQQDATGGFVTLYDEHGVAEGDANTETTAYALLALAELTAPSHD